MLRYLQMSDRTTAEDAGVGRYSPNSVPSGQARARNSQKKHEICIRRRASLQQSQGNVRPGVFSEDPHMCQRLVKWLVLPVCLAIVTRAGAQPAAKAEATSDKEPMAKTMSLAKSAEFLDKVSVTWTEQRKCGACHTNYAYM